MSLHLEGEVKDLGVNLGDGAIQIGKVSTGKDGVSIVCSSSSKEGHSQIQGESIEAGGRVRIETRGGGSSKGRVVFGNIKCSGRVTIIAGGGSESDDDCVVVVEKKKEEKKRAREEEEEDEEDDEEEEEEEDDDDIEIEEESDSEEEDGEDEKKKRNSKKDKGKTTKEVINLDN